MSVSVDEKVLRLKIEKGAFDSGVKAVIARLSEVNEAFKMKGISGSVGVVKTHLKDAGDAITQNLSTKMQDLQKQFPILSTAAGVALGNIASRAVETGASLVKNLAFGGLIDGFREYETQINAVQTIMANTKSKGETMQSVSAVLDELNEYADKTIYNFSEMTRNIGTFTAAGVGLKPAANAIKGISNLAAVTNTNAQDTSRVMFQLSQALSSGVVRLLDWNSVQTAGAMGGELFQEALKRTARAHGQAVDAAIAKNGSFRDSLKEEWLTAEVLTETLSLLTDDIDNFTDAQLVAKGYTEEDVRAMRDLAKTAQDAATKYKTFSDVMGATKESIGSGWAKTWQIIIGDFEQARNFWTPIGNYISDAITAMSDSRNRALQTFVDMGGRTKVIETMYAMFQLVARPIREIGNALSQVFNGSPIKGIITFLDHLKRLIWGFVLCQDEADEFRQVFVGLFSAIKIVLIPIGWAVQLLSALGYAFIRVSQFIWKHFVKAMLFLGSIIGTTVEHLMRFLEWLDPVGRLFQLLGSLASWLSPLFSYLGAVVDGLKESFKAFFGGFQKGLEEAGFDKLAHPIKSIKDLGSVILSKLDAASRVVKNFFSVLGSKISNPFKNLNSDMSGMIRVATNLGRVAGSSIGTALTKIKEFSAFISAKTTPYLRSFFDWVVKVKNGVKGLIPSSLTDSLSKLKSALASIGDVDFSISDTLTSVKNALRDFGSAISEVTGINLSPAIASVKKWASSLFESFASFDISEAIGYIVDKLRYLKSAIIAAFSSAPDVAGAVSDSVGEAGRAAGGVLTKVADGFYYAVNWIKNTFMALWDVLKGAPGGAFDKIVEGFGYLKSSITSFLDNHGQQLLAFFAQGFSLGSIIYIVKTVKDMVEGFSSPFSAAGEAISAFKDNMQAIQTQIKAKAILSIALAVGVLALAMWVVAQIPYVEMGASLGALGAALAGMVVVMRQVSQISGGSAKAIAAGIAIAAVGLAMLYLAKAVSVMKGMNPKQIAAGGLAVGALGAVLASMVRMMSVKSQLKIGTALAIMAVVLSVTILAKTVQKLGELSTSVLAKGGTVVLILMGAIAGFNYLMKLGSDLSPGQGFGMIAVAFTIRRLADEVVQLGEQPVPVLIKGLLAVAAVGAVLAGFMYLMRYSASLDSRQILGLVVVVLSFMVLGNTMMKLGDLSLGALMKGGAALALIGVLLSSMMTILDAKEPSLKSVAVMIAAAVTVYILGSTLALLGLLPLEVALQGVIVMGLIMAQLAALFMVMSTIPNPFGLAFMLLGVSILLVSIAAAMTVFSMMPFTTWLQAVIQLGLTMLVVVGIMMLAQGSVAGAAALAIVSIALIGLALAITIVALVPFAMAAGGMLVLMTALLALVGIAYLAQGAIVGLAVLGGAILGIGLAMLLAGAGVYLFALALGVLGGALVVIAAGIVALGGAAVTVSGQLGALLALAGVLALFGLALIPLGIGAGVAAIGFILLGAAMLILGIGLMLISATAATAVVAIQNFVTGLASLSTWDMGWAVANAAMLAVVGLSLLVFGAGALLAGAGVILLGAGLLVLSLGIVALSGAMSLAIIMMTSLMAVVPVVTLLGEAFAKLATGTVATARSIIAIPNALRGIQLASMMAMAGILMMGQVFGTEFVKMGLVASMFSTLLSAQVVVISNTLMGLVVSVTLSSSLVGAGFSRMVGISQSALEKFVGVILITTVSTAMTLAVLASVTRDGATKVVNGFATMSIFTKMFLDQFFRAVQQGALGSFVSLTMLSANVKAQTASVTQSVALFSTKSSLLWARYVSVLRTAMVSVGTAMLLLPRAIRSGAAAGQSETQSAIRRIFSMMKSNIDFGRALVYGSAYVIGQNIVNGMTDGIRENQSQAIRAAADVAIRSLNAAKSALGIHSPSREFYSIGMYSAQGLADGIVGGAEYLSSAAKSISKVAAKASEEVLEDLSNEFRPTITPVLDLSQVRKEARSISDIFRNPSVSYRPDYEYAQSIATNKMGKQETSEARGPDGQNGSVTTINFVQNNTSPEPLDSLEIYMQTRRQLKELEGLARRK